MFTIKVDNEQAAEGIEDLVNLMYEMSRHEVNEIKTLVYWSIATHGHEHLDKFPILRIFGGTNTGKSNSLHMIEELARGGAFANIKGSTDAAIRSLLSVTSVTKGTCVFDETDEFPYQFYEGIYDKAGSQNFKLKREGANYVLDHDINIWVPVALNGRTPLPDESYQNRTIEINTKYFIDGAREEEYTPGILLPHNKLCAGIAGQIDWEAVQSNKKTRALEVWIPLLAVAEHLNDEEFLVYIEQLVERRKQEGLEGRADEGDHRVLNAIIKLCYIEVEEQGEKFPPKLKQGEVADEIGYTPRETGRFLGILGFETRKSGVMWVENLSPAKLKRVADEIGVNDEWINGLSGGK
ncbi:hypothetical protein OAJ44_00610 [Chloroflexi bacterium]|nr:hypothetical protein [Chloroflexota bacterium]